MKTIRLGKTGLRVSRIGIGGIPIRPPPMCEAVKAIQRALDLEVNFADTPVGYKDSVWSFSKAIIGCLERKLSPKTRGDDKATALKR
jgi:aryl-alcohol dehydrogenase-like predicted oxidoreductase